MLLTPVYDNPSFLRLDLPEGDPAGPLLRQRRRLGSILAGLDDEQWSAPSRCDRWSVQDVATHLVTTNQFWALSIGAARAGEPTRFLATFDPVTSPAELVAAAPPEAPAATLERFVQTTEALAAAVDGLDDGGWSALGEAPPGHVPLRAVALHALWDSWIHERDIVLPLGAAPVEEPDEVAGCLAYAAALGPAFAASRGSARRGTVAVHGTDPDVRVVVEVGDSVSVVAGGDAGDDPLHLEGPAVELVEALAFRVPLPCPVPDRHRWLIGGLAEVFDL